MELLSSAPLAAIGNAKSAPQWRRRAQRLEYVTLAWTAVELFGGLLSGVRASNISLLSFGAQSGIEFALSGVLLWRLCHQDGERQHSTEARALRWAGISFLFVAALTALQAIVSLANLHSPAQSTLGLAVTGAALIVMPVIAFGKRIAAGNLDSVALRTDAKQNSFCAYQAAIVLSALVLYRLLGWWWVDGVAALVLVPFMLVEGLAAIRGRSCGCVLHHHPGHVSP